MVLLRYYDEDETIPLSPLWQKELKEKMDMEGKTGQWAEAWLRRFGYLDPKEGRNDKIAIADFQRGYDLNVDGWLGPKSIRAMKRIRCGCPDTDVWPGLDPQTMKITQPVRRGNDCVWSRDKKNSNGVYELKWHLVKGVDGLADWYCKSALTIAFDKWASVANIVFTYVDKVGNADLAITSASGRDMGFDGPGGTLAYAFLPCDNDRQKWMVFDRDETWRRMEERDRGVAYLIVAVHEIGHLLGIRHINQRGNIMQPTYAPHLTELGTADIERVQAFYGRRTVNPDPDPDPDPPKKPDDPPADGQHNIAIVEFNMTTGEVEARNERR